MSLQPGAQSARRKWHPLVLALAVLAGARAAGLVFHFFSDDPNGNPIAASPANILLVALPYNGAVVFWAAAALFLLWKLAGPLRPAVTAVGVAFCAASIVLGQVDFAMQWFIGHRLSPSTLQTYSPADLLSPEVLGPLRFHPGYLAAALVLILLPEAVLLRGVLDWRSRSAGPGWPLVAASFGLACLCLIPIRIAYGHQRDVLRPPELLFVNHWLVPNNTPQFSDERAAMAQLRRAADVSGDSRWIDPRYPLARAFPPERNRYIPAGAHTPPDIVIFAVESLRGADVGYVPGNYPSGGSPTPNLDRLAAGSVVFSHYIANGNPSPRGFISINSGMWDHRGSFIISGFTATDLDALAPRMRDMGYATMAFWGSNPSFDNQLYWANKWYQRVEFALPGNELFYVHRMGDDLLVDRLIRAVREHDASRPQQPFFAYVATAGTHEPYTLEGETRLPADEVRKAAAITDVRQRYRFVLRNLDQQLSRAVAFLDSRHTGRGVVVVVVGDHSDAAGDSRPEELRGMPDNPAVWTAALILGPADLVGPPRVETFPCSHVDLTPTLLDIAGDHRPIVSPGTNLFAAIPPQKRTAIAVSGQGFRLDRGGWSLFVFRDRPDEFYTRQAFAGDGRLRRSLDGSPFSAADVRALWENFNTWSFLLENNRVWSPRLLSEAPP
jgi:arylsulfatase A-like enzyme